MQNSTSSQLCIQVLCPSCPLTLTAQVPTAAQVQRINQNKAQVMHNTYITSCQLHSFGVMDEVSKWLCHYTVFNSSYPYYYDVEYHACMYIRSVTLSTLLLYTNHWELDTCIRINYIYNFDKYTKRNHHYTHLLLFKCEAWPTIPNTTWESFLNVLNFLILEFIIQTFKQRFLLT